MVAAGVIPIDRLTDVRAPVEVVAARCGAPQLAAVYGLRFVAPAGAEGSSSEAAGGTWYVSAVRVLAALAVTRGWVSGSGLPDEARAGRQILKDYTSGKLLFCQLPPGHPVASFAPAGAPGAKELEGLQLQPLQQRAAAQPGSSSDAAAAQAVPEASSQAGTPNSNSSSATTAPARPAAGDEAEDDSSEESAEESAEEAGPGPSSSNQEATDGLRLDMADLELLDELGGAAQQKSKRADHKFHKKAARSKGNRGQEMDAGGYDGAALLTGKKGGLVRVAGY
jgi:large subunit GTPase 1